MSVYDLSGRARAAELIKELHKTGGVSLEKSGELGSRLRKSAARQVLCKSLEKQLAKVGVRVRDPQQYERLDDSFDRAGIRRDSVEVLKKAIAPLNMRKGLALPPEDSGTQYPGGSPHYGAVDPHDSVSEGFTSEPATPSLITPAHASAFSAPSRATVNAPNNAQSTEDRSVEAIKKALAGPRQQWFER